MSANTAKAIFPLRTEYRMPAYRVNEEFGHGDVLLINNEWICKQCKARKVKLPCPHMIRLTQYFAYQEQQPYINVDAQRLRLVAQRITAVADYLTAACEDNVPNYHLQLQDAATAAMQLAKQLRALAQGTKKEG